MKSILLTGASGVIGQALLKCLTESTIVCLVRRTPVHSPNAVSVTGDVSLPRLGLSRGEYANLAKRIDVVIHCAAVTDFSQPQAAIVQANVDGTRHMLELAATANVPLYYIGTAFSGSVGQANGFAANAYELSKGMAEAVVKASGVPNVIIRPSIIIGDSKTGEIARAQGFHLIMKLLAEESLPVLPIAPAMQHGYLDFIPQDVVARIIAGLVIRGDSKGEYWLTQGDDALRVKTVVDLCIEHATRITGRTVSHPRAVDPEVFDRLIRPAFFPTLPANIRRVIEYALSFAKYLNMDRPLPTSLPSLELQSMVGPLPSLELTFVRNLERLLGRRKRIPQYAD